MAGVGEAQPTASQVAAAELELGLARRPDVYLVLSPTERRVEVRVRGLVLDSIPLSAVEVVLHSPLLGRSAPPAFRLPAVWRIVHGPGDTDREYIAPTELRPYNPDGYDDPPAVPTPPSAPGPAPTATPIPEPPPSYRARLDNGWDIWVVTQLPPRNFFARAAAAVRDGWRRLRGHSSHLPPAVTWAMAPEDARRLHHLMRGGMAILILGQP